MKANNIIENIIASKEGSAVKLSRAFVQIAVLCAEFDTIMAELSDARSRTTTLHWDIAVLKDENKSAQLYIEALEKELMDRDVIVIKEELMKQL